MQPMRIRIFSERESGPSMRTHTGEKIYKCKMCPFSCNHNNNMRNHEKSQHKIPCTHCEHKAKNDEHLKRHVDAVHLNLKGFACNSCDYKSYFDKNVMIHIKSQHKDLISAKSQKLDCSDCMSNIDHNKHKKERKTLFVCKICEYETKNRGFLKNHRRLVHGDKSVASKVLKCADCEFEATNVKHLENHINSEHLNEKRFSCNLCDFQSFYSQSVKSHISYKHKGSTTAQMKTLECSDCQLDIKHSKCSPLLKKEKRKRRKAPYKKKAKTCQQCSFVTLKRSYLRKHVALSHDQDSDPTK